MEYNKLNLILDVILILIIYRFICFYLTSDDTGLSKKIWMSFYTFAAITFLAIFLPLYLVQYAYRTGLDRNLLIVLRIYNRQVLGALFSILDKCFWILFTAAGLVLIIEIFFPEWIALSPKHGPKFNVARLRPKDGIVVGHFERDVLPKSIRQFAPAIAKEIIVPYNRLARGVTILGDMGCGKSRLMAIFEESIRKKYPDIPILIHDPKGEWLRSFYNPKTDLIFAPYDFRSAIWSLWADFSIHPELIHSVVATAVEAHHSGQTYDRFWTDSATTLLEDVAKKSGIYSAKKYLQELHKKNVENKTWASIYTTAIIGFRDIASVELMGYECDWKPGLSIDEFLKVRGRIFLLNNPSIASEQHGGLTLFLTAFMMRVLAQSDVSENELRAVVILDEALTFHLPADVEKAVFTQSRSKGLSVIASAQRLPKEHLGERGAWSDHPSHIFGMRITDLASREALAKRIGTITYTEKQKSTSISHKNLRDKSITESETERHHQAVAPEDWALENRQFILFHEKGIAPGWSKNIDINQRPEIEILEYNPRPDITRFMAGLG